MPGLALCCAVSLAGAQAPGAEPAKKADLSPAERAQRDADKVFQWIRFSGEKSAVKPAPVVAAPAAKLAPRPLAAAAAARPTAPSDKLPEPTPAPALAAAPVPAPVPAEAPALLAVAAPTTAPLPSPLPPVAQAAEPAPMPELPLKLINRVEPEITRQLLASVRGGSVVVTFRVRPDGSVEQAEAQQPANRKLAAAAVKAVSQWRFEPIAQARGATVELGFDLDH